MRKTKFIRNVLAGFVMMSSLAIAPSVVTAANEYDTVNGGQVQFEKYLIYSSDANCPTAEFTFQIANGTAIAADLANHKSAVGAGTSDPSVTGTPVLKNAAASTDSTKNGKALFTNAKSKYTSAEAIAADAPIGAHSGLTSDPVNLASGEAYSKDEIIVDFGGVTFSEPGVYRWVISEDAMTPAQTELGFVRDTDYTRYIDVYVADKGVKTSGDTDKWDLEVTGYVLHNTDNFQPSDLADSAVEPGEDVNTKAKGFINRLETHNLTISNAVSGNQASHDKYFKYDISLTGAGANTKIAVDVSHADATTVANGATIDSYEGATNSNELTTLADGTLSATYYLQHDQYIILKGLPLNTGYTIIETAEDYVPSAAITGDTKNGTATSTTDVALVRSEVTGSSTTGTVTDSDLVADATVAFGNARNGTIPTGVLTTVLPGAALIAVAACGFVFLKKRRKNDEESANEE